MTLPLWCCHWYQHQCVHLFHQSTPACLDQVYVHAPWGCLGQIQLSRSCGPLSIVYRHTGPFIQLCILCQLSSFGSAQLHKGCPGCQHVHVPPTVVSLPYYHCLRHHGYPFLSVIPCCVTFPCSHYYLSQLLDQHIELPLKDACEYFILSNLVFQFGQCYSGDCAALGQLMDQCWCLNFFSDSATPPYLGWTLWQHCPFINIFSLAALTGDSQYLSWEEVYCTTPALDGYPSHCITGVRT